MGTSHIPLMSRAILAWIALWPLLPCPGAIYYVDVDAASGGNGSLERPWRGLSDIRRLSPGDSVLFQRGDMWRGTLLVPWSGSPGNPITFGAYGSGPDPILTGSDDLTNGAYSWQRSSKGKNEYYCAFARLEPPDTIWLDGTNVTKGAAGSLADHQWDWADDDSLGFSTVYLRDDSGDPGASGVLVESAARDYIIYATGMHDLVFENLELCDTDNGINGFGAMTFHACTDITIRGCTIHDIVAHGIRFLGTGSAHHTIERNVLYNALPVYDYPCLIGLYQTDTATISKNTIYNALGLEAVGVTIQGGSTHITIEENEIRNCNGDHVYLRDFASGNTVRYNYIHDGTGVGVMLRQGANDNDVYGNLILEIRNCIGLSDVDGSVANLNICNNTCRNETSASYDGLSIDGKHSNIRIQNNIVWTRDGYALWVDAAASSAVTSDYNCFYNTSSGHLIHWGQTDYPPRVFSRYRKASGQDAHSINQNPRFADIPGGDYSLAVNSPCINSGISLDHLYRLLDPNSTWPYGVRSLDPDSVAARWEMGAYAYKTATTLGYP